MRICGGFVDNRKVDKVRFGGAGAVLIFSAQRGLKKHCDQSIIESIYMSLSDLIIPSFDRDFR